MNSGVRNDGIRNVMSAKRSTKCEKHTEEVTAFTVTV